MGLAGVGAATHITIAARHLTTGTTRSLSYHVVSERRRRPPRRRGGELLARGPATRALARCLLAPRHGEEVEEEVCCKRSVLSPAMLVLRMFAEEDCLNGLSVNYLGHPAHSTPFTQYQYPIHPYPFIPIHSFPCKGPHPAGPRLRFRRFRPVLHNLKGGDGARGRGEDRKGRRD